MQALKGLSVKPYRRDGRVAEGARLESETLENNNVMRPNHCYQEVARIALQPKIVRRAAI